MKRTAMKTGFCVLLFCAILAASVAMGQGTGKVFVDQPVYARETNLETGKVTESFGRVDVNWEQLHALFEKRGLMAALPSELPEGFALVGGYASPYHSSMNDPFWAGLGDRAPDTVEEKDGYRIETWSLGPDTEWDVGRGVVQYKHPDGQTILLEIWPVTPSSAARYTRYRMGNATIGEKLTDGGKVIYVDPRIAATADPDKVWTYVLCAFEKDMDRSNPDAKTVLCYQIASRTVDKDVLIAALKSITAP